MLCLIAAITSGLVKHTSLFATVLKCGAHTIHSPDLEQLVEVLWPG